MADLDVDEQTLQALLRAAQTLSTDLDGLVKKTYEPELGADAFGRIPGVRDLLFNGYVNQAQEARNAMRAGDQAFDRVAAALRVVAGNYRGTDASAAASFTMLGGD